MLGSDFKGHAVTRVLVEELLPIAHEFYTSVLLDRSVGEYLWMLTAEGGMDIETLAGERPEALRRVHVNPGLGLRAWHLRELVGVLPVDARDGGSQVLRAMWSVVQEADATLVEINPLVQLEGGEVVALDAKVTVDDNALFRHPDLEALQDAFPVDPVEKRAKDADLQYVKLDGSVGIIGNGAGLVTSLQVILSDPSVRCVFINIFGGITRCDVVAEGILEALKQVEATVPIVVRLDGTNAEEGRRILAEAAHPRIVPVATMDAAAEEAARLADAA
jgi:succinyl-CoA synthetase beta subunit